MRTEIRSRAPFRRTFIVLRSIGGVVITVAIILADVVKSTSGGGASSSAYPTVILPRSKTKPSADTSSEEGPITKKKRPHRKRQTLATVFRR